MKLKRVRIRNFRCFDHETTIDLEDFTAFVGRNDVGKSAVLDALGLFFGEYTLDSDDGSVNGDKSDIAVICEFSELPAEFVIDVDFRVTPSGEYIVNSRGYLQIHRVFNGALQKPRLARTFLVAHHPSADGYADLLYLKNRELKARAQELGIDLTNVDQRINSALRRAIWQSAPDLLVREQEIDIEKEDAKKIWTVLSKQLPIFALFHSDRKSSDQDEEAQGPLKSAVDEALQAREESLNELTDFVKDRVLAIARATVEKLSEMDPTLAQELNPRFKKPDWSKVFGISLTDDSQIPVNKRGSGVRRLILLNFLRALAEKRLANSEAPGIIYAIEEPETSQHPISQRLLLSAIRQLSEQPGCQVLITTHTPVLVRDLPLSSLKFVSKEETGSRVIHQGADVTYQSIARSLGVIPDHDVRLFIGVEGINDIDFLRGISKILRINGEDVLDLGDLEDQGKLIFIPLGGSNLALWTHRLAGLNRPEFHLFDRDDQPPTRSRHQDAADAINARGSTALLTGKREMENYLHPDAIRAAIGVAIHTGDFDDVPAILAEQIHSTSGSRVAWNELNEDKQSKKISSAKRRLNTEAVARMTPALLTAVDPTSDVRHWLNEIRRLYQS
jgi:putative ATP-dependent endonuclease of OLD family